MTRLWVIRRLRKLGLDDNFQYDVYIKEIRSVLEYCVPVWNGNLTETNSYKIEQVQKRVFKIILNQKYTTYEEACNKFNTCSLKERREALCLKFARKEVKKSHSMFTRFTPKFSSRSSTKMTVNEIFCCTEHYFNSGIPYLARLLNKHGTQTSK